MEKLMIDIDKGNNILLCFSNSANAIAKVYKVEDAELIVTAVNHHDELVEALKTAKLYFERYNCGGHTKGHDGKIYMDQGSAYLEVFLALSKLPTQ